MARGGFRPGAGRKKGSGKKAKETAPSPLLVKAEEIVVFYAGLMEKVRSGQKMTPDDRKQLNALLQDMVHVHGGGQIAPAEPGDETRDAKEYLEKLLVSTVIDRKSKIQVANILLPFQHPRVGEGGRGKKDQKADRAKAAAEGKYAPAPAPLKLVK